MVELVSKFSLIDELQHKNLYMVNFMNKSISTVLSDLNLYCFRQQLCVTFNPGGMLLVSDKDGSEAFLSIDELVSLIKTGSDPDFVKYPNWSSANNNEELTLSDLSELSKMYDLDITISDDVLNVFNAQTDKQGSMSVEEFKEYIQYLESHIKFSDRMK